MEKPLIPATAIRHDYKLGGLSQDEAGSDPMHLADEWIEQAGAAGLSFEPSTACLSTVNAEGTPSARMVVIRRLDHDRGAFCFYTNFRSRKARDINERAVASLTFFWGELQRQIRVIGRVEKLSREDAEAYFATRPEPSQRSAWMSDHQSSPVKDRQSLEQGDVEIRLDPATGAIECPPFWGGYAVIADELEFWTGREGRMHDRVLFMRRGSHELTVLTDETVAEDVWTQVTDPHGIAWLRARLRP